MSLEIFLDKPRALRLDMNALSLFETATGRSALDPSTWFAIRAGDITALVWAAITAHAQAPYYLQAKVPPDDLDVPTLSQLRAMIDASRLTELREILDQAWGFFFPDADEGAEPDTENPPEA